MRGIRGERSKVRGIGVEEGTKESKQASKKEDGRYQFPAYPESGSDLLSHVCAAAANRGPMMVARR